MQIFLHRDGQQSGPFSLDEVRAQFASGVLKPTDLAWYEGAADWMRVSSLPGLAVNAPALSPPPFQPQVTGVTQAQQTPGIAIASMVLGLLGLFFGFLTGIPAVICGHIALSRIRQAGGALSGRGLAITGLVTGYLSIFLLFIVAMLAAIALPIFSSVQLKGLEVKSLSNAKQIALGCRLYASDNGGKFPPKLEDLVPTYVQDTKIFIDPLDPQHSPQGYDYFGGTDSDPPEKVLLQSKVANHGKRVVVYTDGSGVIKHE